MIKEFKRFILRGNLIDLAIGFTVGASFTTVARSLVNDIIMPPVSFVLGQSDFSNLFLVIKQGNPSGPYQTFADAQSAAAITINYGEFLNNLVALLLVAVAMFAIVHTINRLEKGMETATQKGKDDKDTPSNKKCSFCYSTIDYRATRCAFCSANLEVKKDP